jgi:hypothetical protein
MNKPELNQRSIWQGYLSGTNRGEIFVSLKKAGDILDAKAVFYDRQYGSTIISLNGRQSDGKAEFRLLRFQGPAPLMPLDGSLILNFAENFSTAEGNWQTDIGTSGICKLQISTESSFNFFARILTIEVARFIQRLMPSLYAIFLCSIAIATLVKLVDLSAIILILLLLPAPFFFAVPVSKFITLLRSSGIKKLGPLEIEQQSTPNTVINTAGQFATQHIPQSTPPQAQEIALFEALNRFFVFRTKLVLVVVTQKQIMPPTEFLELTTALGVQPANIELTQTALIQSCCVELLPNGGLHITDFGRRYVLQGIRFP